MSNEVRLGLMEGSAASKDAVTGGELVISRPLWWDHGW